MFKINSTLINRSKFKKSKLLSSSIKKLKTPPNRKNKENNRIVFSFGRYVRDFCDNTSLHGLRFVGDKNLTIFERAFFGIAFLIAFIVSIQFTYNVYTKWTSTPVIIGLSAKPYFINDIPFPAVTICNMNQALASKVRSIDKNCVEYPILQTLCSREPDLDSEAVNSTSDWTVFEKFLVERAQPCENMLLSCKFGSVKFNCSEIFKTVITDEGLCCSFNTVDPFFMYKDARKHFNRTVKNATKGIAVDWTPEKGYPPGVVEDFYPRAAIGTGSNLGLTVILDAQIPEYYCSSANGAGFKVLLHNPIEIPKVGETGIFLNAGAETRVVITPHKSDASHALRNIKKKYRQCIFDDEGNLSFYTTYSRRNCEKECEAKLQVNECNCISYYMSRPMPNISICGLKDFKCLENVAKKTQQSNQLEEDCSDLCISSCFELSFEPETFSTALNHSRFKIEDRFIQGIPNDYAMENIAAVHFYYMDKAFRSYIKEQFIGFTEFLSNTGGLMSLFLGFSFISLIELFYYLTFRIYCDKKRIKRINNTKIIKNVSPDFEKAKINKLNMKDIQLRY